MSSYFCLQKHSSHPTCCVVVVAINKQLINEHNDVGHSSSLVVHSARRAITNDQTLHIIAHHLADVLRWLGSPHSPRWPSKSLRWSTLITPSQRQLRLQFHTFEWTTAICATKLQRQSNDFGETGGGEVCVWERGFVILRRTADEGNVDARMLTALAFEQCAVIACKWSRICILTRLH